MIRARIIFIGAAFCLSACGNGAGNETHDTEQSLETNSENSDRLTELGAEIEDLSTKLKSCQDGAGEACHWLGDHFKKVHAGQLSGTDDMSRALQRKVKLHYKLGCDAGYDPACQAFSELE